jgi:acyl carrier protein
MENSVTTSDLLEIINKSRPPGQQVSLNSLFNSVNIDSLDLVEFLFEVEEKFGIDLDYNLNVDRNDENSTVGGVLSGILEKIESNN